MTTTAAAAGTRRHTFPAEPAQVRQARAALAGWLTGCPLADEVILVASEFAANAVLHSASRDGGAFTLRAETCPGYVRIEVEDAGGPWRTGPRDVGRPHGLDLVAAIASPGNWGIDGTTVVGSPGPGSAGDMRMTIVPPPADAVRVSRFLVDHPPWSAWWDKKHGLWRVAEDDPDSDLYAESADIDAVIGYIAAHR